MRPTDLAFYALAANPIGGLFVAIPFAMLKLDYPAWRAVVLGVPFSYLQVVAVDLSWTFLAVWPPWHRFLNRRRSPRIEKLLAARGAFWVTFLATPLVGSWMVMAFMRYGHVSQRRVMLPILAACSVLAIAVAVGCATVPALFAAR